MCIRDRGSIAELDGHYFFADFVTERIWSFKFNQDNQVDFDATNFTDFTDWTDIIETGSPTGITAISSFGEDNNGNLFVVSLGGTVFRLNSVDAILLGDVNMDGVVNFLDIQPFIDAIFTGFQSEADVNQDGNVNFLDIQPFIDLLSIVG